MVDYYHICTHGGELPWMFQDEEDFIVGTNRIAICKHIIGISILDYTLMDNHIHLLVKSDLVNCKAFINKFKAHFGKWLHYKHGTTGHLKHLATEIIKINSHEQLLKVLAYIDRNSIKAGFHSLPTYYQWGGAKYLFSPESENNFTRKISDLSSNKQILRLRTRIKLPQEWTMDENYMIDPRCFLDINSVKSIIQTPNKYIYHLSQKIEGEIEQMFTNTNNTFIPDKDLRVIVNKIAQDQFRSNDIKSLDVKSRIQIAKKLRYEYASTHKQISRMLYLDLEMLKGFI